MNCIVPKLLLAGVMVGVPACAQERSTPLSGESSEVLRLVNTFALPEFGPGNFDHFAFDLKRHRLFATPEEAKMVLVIDASSGVVIHKIQGIDRPHAILYRPDNDRLYVTDGVDGSIRVFDGESYKQIARAPVLKDADAIGYDISTKALYVANGGKDVGQPFSHLSVIDTTNYQKIRDIEIKGETLEAMALDNYRPRLYINNTARNSVTVVDRFTHAQIVEWPIKGCKDNVALALDEQRQRLFVGCRSSQLVVMDSNTGAEVQTLAIHDGVGDVIYDPASRRLYASTNGFVDVFSQRDLNHYLPSGSVASAEKARTARLVPEVNRLFVAAPKSGSSPARVLEFEPLNLPPAPAPKVEAKEPVTAPPALKIVEEEMSLHPTLRRMGLHAIPPGRQTMVIIANANETRIGIPTSAGDFTATKEGKISGPRIADGEFFNMKMPLLDAQGRRIGILVMEIPWTDAATEEDAAHQADGIRSEISRRIPSVDALFSPNVN